METTHVIVDCEKNVYLDSLDIQDVYRSSDGTIPFRVTKRRLHGGVQDGLDVVEIDTGRLNFVVLLSRGMNILKARSGDVDLKWDSPVNGPVHPKFVPIFAPGGCGWLEGFCEWVARCGLESNGAPEFDANGVLKYPLHGRLSNLPARRVEASVDPETGEIRLTGEVMETSVFGRKFLFKTTYTVQAGSAKLKVEDSVTNLLHVADEFELLYHINTGYPLVSPGARFVAAFQKMCPRDGNAVLELSDWNVFTEPVPGKAETCYFFDLAADDRGETGVALIRADGQRGVSLKFNKNDFPYFILWKTQRPNGDIYVSGMEPAVNFPNTRSFEKKNGRVVPIAPKETKTFGFEFNVLSSEPEVDGFIKGVESLQSSATGEIIPSPVPEWCE